MARTTSSLYLSFSVVLSCIGLYYALTWVPVDEEIFFVVPAPRGAVYALLSDPNHKKQFSTVINRIEEHWGENGTYTYTVWEDIPLAFNITLPSSVRFIPTMVENESIHTEIITNPIFQKLAVAREISLFEDVAGQEGVQTKVTQQIKGAVARFLWGPVLANWKNERQVVQRKILEEFEQRRREQ